MLLEDYAYRVGGTQILQRLHPSARIRRQAEWWTRKEAVAKADGGAGGIPVVAGRKRHALLGMPKTRVFGIEPGNGHPGRGDAGALGGQHHVGADAPG